MNSIAESPNVSWHLLPPRRPQLKSVLCRPQSRSRTEKAADAVVAPVAPAGPGGTPAAHTAPVSPIRAVGRPRARWCCRIVGREGVGVPGLSFMRQAVAPLMAAE